MMNNPQDNVKINKLWDIYIGILFAKKTSLAILLTKIQNLTLEEYSNSYKTNKSIGIEKKEDVINEVYKTSISIFGEETALRILSRFNYYSNIFTAHHHSPDYLNITIQSSIIASLGETTDSILPIFAVSLIPLNNYSYPQGIIISNKPGNSQKYTSVNIFPKKMQRTGVKFAPSMKKDQIDFSIKEIEKLWTSTTNLNKVTIQILKEEYLSEHILNQPNFSTQISLLNSKIWQRLFQSNVFRSDILFLEIEKLTTPTIIKDIENSNSLLYNLLFNDNIRNSILINLNSVPCCWDIEQHKGTFCFWYSSKDKTYPLFLENHKLKGDNIEIDFTPEDIIKKLRSNEIVPSLFTIYTTLAFVRGFKLVGGMMQIDYTTKMKEGIAMALKEVGNTDWAEKVASVETETYLAGLTAIVTDYGNGEIFPSGTIEIISNGGLSNEDLEKIKKLTVKEASLLGMPDVLKIITTAEEYKASGFDQYTVASIYELIADKLVTIKI